MTRAHTPLPYHALSWLAGAAARLRPGGGEDWGQRLGHVPQGPRGGVWLHGASVGEIASAQALIAALAAQMPVTMTTNTTTGRARAAAAGVRASLAPLDTPQALARFLDRVQPAVAVTVENELWPNRSAMLAARGIAQVVVGARLSARSASRWGRLPRLAATLLGRIDALSAQDAASEARLLDLGLPPGALLPRVNLKRWSAAVAPPLPPGPARGRTVLAASTHAAEEAAILDAMAAVRAAGGRVIVAPRHPDRFDAIAAAMTARGMPPARRAQGAGAEADVLLADTLGEMALWCAAAGIVVTGGSFAALGGHTPWEAAAQGCAILHGPHIANFAEDYAELDAAGAAHSVTADDLAPTLCGLLDRPEAAAIGQRARALLTTGAGDGAPLIAAIRRLHGPAPAPISDVEARP